MAKKHTSQSDIGVQLVAALLENLQEHADRCDNAAIQASLAGAHIDRALEQSACAAYQNSVATVRRLAKEWGLT